MLRNSIVQLIRTPTKSILFLLLILAATLFLTLGSSLWVINNRNMEYYEESFVTIGKVEQRATSVEQGEYWYPVTREYVIINRAVYGDRIPISVLDFEGAEYINPPENRPHYGSYNPEYKSDNEFTSTILTVIEFIPLEEGTINESVEVSVSKILSGHQLFEGQTIRICDEAADNPQTLNKGKTYIAGIYAMPRNIDGEWVDEYVPVSVIKSYQFNPDGTRVPDELDSDIIIYEITDDFYTTEIGNRFIEYAKSLDRGKFAIPVTGTNATILLMPFYNKSAYIQEGRDITEQEYDNGDKVCLIPRKLAKENELNIGDSMQLRLYFADYRSSASERFDGSYIADINSEGEAYSVFEDSTYTIVGIYNMTSFESNRSYSLAEKEVIIPSKSIKNSDENNIVNFGPLKGSMASFRIPNEYKEEFIVQWEALGIEQLDINFYDRGYSKLKVGMENMKKLSLMMIIFGAVVVIFVLILFSNIFISKEERRIAIERSLGMKKSKCMLTIILSISIILILGSILGGSIGGAVSFRTYQNNIDSTHYEMLYSSGSVESGTDEDERNIEEDTKLVMLISLLSMISVIFIGEGILLNQISRKLRLEPMVLLYRLSE